MALWMIRAQSDGSLYQPFKDFGKVAIGWQEIGDFSTCETRQSMIEAVQACYPERKSQANIVSAGMLYRFAFKLAIGDRVVTYDKQRRVYSIGTISSDYHHDPAFNADAPNTRDVTWDPQEIDRDKLRISTRNSLGSTLTLFRLSATVEAEFEALLRGDTTQVETQTLPLDTEDSETADEDHLLEDIEARSLEFIKDHIARLDWEDVENLVAGLLRAMGYKTRMTQRGSDRGKDIIASPDGFGFEEPRIFVEVKHRRGSMGAPDLRSFLGGLKAGDKGLYVSTGGFTREARYQSDNHAIPLALMDFDDLVRAIIDNYERIDTETRRLVPLKRIYWPLG